MSLKCCSLQTAGCDQRDNWKLCVWRCSAARPLIRPLYPLLRGVPPTFRSMHTHHPSTLNTRQMLYITAHLPGTSDTTPHGRFNLKLCHNHVSPSDGAVSGGVARAVVHLTRSLMSFSVAACDLTAMEVEWLNSSPADSLCVSAAALDRPYSPRLCRRTVSASPTQKKRQRLSASQQHYSIVMARPQLQPSAVVAPIEQITPGLLTAVAPFLSTKEKLLHLTHLSHSFPALIPACFRHDDINLNTSLVHAIAASKRPHLFSQLQSLN